MNTAIISIVVGVASSVVTFFLTKRKYDSEVDGQHIKNLGDAFERYKKLTDEMYKSQDLKIKELQEENERLKKQVNHLQTQMIELLNAVCFDATCKVRKAGFPANTPLHSVLVSKED